MNTEAFEQILQMVGQAGDGAFVLAIIYLGIPYFKTIVWMGVIYIIVTAVRRVIEAFTFLRKVADVVGHAVGADVYDTDRRKVLSAVNRAQAALEREQDSD